MKYQRGTTYTPAELVALTRAACERLRVVADAIEKREDDAPYGALDFEAEGLSRTLADLEFEMVVYGV